MPTPLPARRDQKSNDPARWQVSQIHLAVDVANAPLTLDWGESQEGAEQGDLEAQEGASVGSGAAAGEERSDGEEGGGAA